MQKLSTGTVFAALFTLVSSASATPFPRYNEEFPSVSAILANRDSLIATPKATLVHHGVHVIDGANMAEFFEIFLSLNTEQRLKFLQDGKWPDAAWEQVNTAWFKKLLDTISQDKKDSAINSVPMRVFRKIPLAEVESILRELYSSADRYTRKQDAFSKASQAAFMSRWFESNYPTKDLMVMKAASYTSLKAELSICGTWCSDLRRYLVRGWSDAVVAIADQMTVAELTVNLPLIDSFTKKTAVMKKWMGSPNTKAAIEKLTPAELTALLKVVPSDDKSKIVDIWIAAANGRAAMTPAEVQSVMAVAPDESKQAVMEGWMKAANSQPQ